MDKVKVYAEASGYCCTGGLCIGGFFAVIGYLVFMIVLPVMVASYPRSCFDALSGCLVVNVTASTTASGSTCFDMFQFIWSPADLAGELNSSLVVERANASTCNNAGFDPTNVAPIGKGDLFQCYRITDVCLQYAENFNCAVLSPRCYTMEAPQSNFSSAFNVVVNVGVLYSLTTIAIWLVAQMKAVYEEPV